MFASEAQIKALNPVHVLRGAQLAWLGLARGLQNPKLYTSAHYKQLAIAVFAGLFLHFLMLVPIYLLKASVGTASVFVDLNRAMWEQDLYNALQFIQHWVVSIPFLMLNFFRNVEPQPFDELFMESMRWVDHVYVEKHEGEAKQDLRNFYITTLQAYRPTYKNTFYTRTAKRAAFGLALYSCSFIPKLGRFVFPAFSFYTLNRAVGLLPAAGVFGIASLVLPRHYFVVLLQTYFSTRSLTRQLLLPYFARVGSGFTGYQKAKWFREREGVLFGFTLPFFILMRVPYVGVLAYGIASASAAFLVSKVTRPPPQDTSLLKEYVQEEVSWTQGRRNVVKAGWEKLQEFDVEVRHPDQASSKASSSFELPPHLRTKDKLTREDDPLQSTRSRKSSRGSSDDDWIKLSQSAIS